MVQVGDEVVVWLRAVVLGFVIARLLGSLLFEATAVSFLHAASAVWQLLLLLHHLLLLSVGGHAVSARVHSAIRRHGTVRVQTVGAWFTIVYFKQRLAESGRDRAYGAVAARDGLLAVHHLLTHHLAAVGHHAIAARHHVVRDVAIETRRHGQTGGWQTRWQVTAVEKVVLQNHAHGRSRVGIGLEQRVDQILRLRTHLVLRNGVLVLLDLGIRVLQTTGLERRLANQQRVQNAAQRPHVDLVRVALFVEHLGRYIVGRAAQSLFPLALKVNSGRQTEIANLELHVVVQKQVAQLQVSVNDFVVVQVLAREHYLPHEVARLGLRDRFAPLVHFHEGAAAAQLQYDVHVLIVLEKGVKLDNVLMMDGPVNGDLLGHFLFLMLLGEQLFGHDFARVNLFRIQVGELVAAGEAALAQEFAAHVAHICGRVDDNVRNGNVLFASAALRG